MTTFIYFIYFIYLYNNWVIVCVDSAVKMDLDLYARNQDPLTFIPRDTRSQLQISGIPASMVMNTNSIAPLYFKQQSVQS